MLTAVYVPPGLRRDGYYAQSCRAYATRRGYPEPVVCRSWDAVHDLLAAGTAEVVIVATREHCAGTTVVRAEVAEDPGLATVAILACRRNDRPPSADDLLDAAERRWRSWFPRSG